MFWKVVGGVLVLAVGAYGVRRYMLRHQHTAACPSATDVQTVVTDLDSNRISIVAAQLRADAWEHDGCQLAADAVRAMIRARQAKEALLSGAAKIGEAIVNWIPGCTPPAGFSPPADWMPGSVPSTSLPGWTIPAGWKVGDPLPAGAACPPGWSTGAKAAGFSTGSNRARVLARR
jgi:hypothetical protein